MRKSPRNLLFVGILALGTVCGCSRTPPPPEGPSLDPSGIAQAAMTEYDANSDGRLDAEELKQSPPLTEAMETMDADHDGALTAGEIESRIKAWLDYGVVVMTQTTQVTLDNKPLDGATVTYEPEPFFGDAYRPASAVTDEAGCADVQGQDTQYPGLYLGLYRVRISKQVAGREIVPARYNTETVLAKEIAPGAASIEERRLEFSLQSR